MKIAYSDLFTLDAVAASWLKKNTSESKLKYAIEKKFAKEMTLKRQDYMDSLEEISINNCTEITREDGTKYILLIDKERQFSKEATSQKNKQEKELWNKKIDFKEYIIDANDVPDKLTDQERECFEGVLIPLPELKLVKKK